MKTSWPDTSRRGKEAAMYRASSGLFGTIPHICSYEGVGEHRQVISNILFLPRDGDIAKYHWPIFSSDPPEKPDLRTLWFTICGVEGQSLVEATSPRQLSRAWVHFVLGASVGVLRCFLPLIYVSRRVVIDIPIWVHAGGCQHWKRFHDDNSCGEEGIRDT